MLYMDFKIPVASAITAAALSEPRMVSAHTLSAAVVDGAHFDCEPACITPMHSRASIRACEKNNVLFFVGPYKKQAAR